VAVIEQVTLFLSNINSREISHHLEEAVTSLKMVLEQEQVDPSRHEQTAEQRQEREERLMRYDLMFLHKRLQDAPTMDDSCETAVYDDSPLAGFKQNLAHLLTTNKPAIATRQQHAKKHALLPQGVSPGRKLLHNGGGMLSPSPSTTSKIRTPASAGGTSLSPLMAKAFCFTPQPQLTNDSGDDGWPPPGQYY
jgi:hypothetical protein